MLFVFQYIYLSFIYLSIYLHLFSHLLLFFSLNIYNILLVLLLLLVLFLVNLMTWLLFSEVSLRLIIYSDHLIAINVLILLILSYMSCLRSQFLIQQVIILSHFVFKTYRFQTLISWCTKWSYFL